LVVRNVRKLMGVAFPVLGMAIVFAAILVPAISLNLQLQIGVVLAGLLIIETGVWKLTSKILPNERKYLTLRAEVDTFIDQIRVLNTQGELLRVHDTENSKESFRETVDALHASVDRMAEVAGRPD
jgi:hypothetical protein